MSHARGKVYSKQILFTKLILNWIISTEIIRNFNWPLIHGKIDKNDAINMKATQLETK
jgi:hypothetical protein